MRTVRYRIGFALATTLVIYYASLAIKDNEGWLAVWHIFLAACFVEIARFYYENEKTS